MSRQDAALQLKALSELYDLYHRLSGAEPIRREATTPAGCKALGALFQVRCWNLKDLGPRIVAARKKLLATGFIVPDSWLTVRTSGKLDLCRPGLMRNPDTGKVNATAKKANLLVLTDEGPDVAGLATVCREIEVAMLRLEVAPRAEPAGTAPETSKSPKRVAPWIAAAAKIAAKKIRAAKGRTVKAETLVLSLPPRKDGKHMKATTFRTNVGPKLLTMGFLSKEGPSGGYYNPARCRRIVP